MVNLNGNFPSSLQRASSWRSLVGGTVPVVMIRPEDATVPVPFLLWFHGRTVTKELDPGRYLRLLRAGIGCVAVDLPGHGERLIAAMQSGEHTLEIAEQAAGEIDSILREVDERVGEFGFDCKRAVMGGMSAGGMAAIVRGCTAHDFRGLLLESTTGDWEGQRGRASFRPEIVARLNPITHLSHWTDCPVLALHSALDELVPIVAQRRFIDAIRARSANPQSIQLHAYERTGAPYEHMGFGKMAIDAKDRATKFVADCCGVNIE